METPDGITVRLLEDLITEELGIGQAISIRKKIDGLLNPLVRDPLQKELKILLGKVKDCILTSGITEITEIATTWDKIQYRNMLGKDSKIPNQSLNWQS
ncbi:MAG: hypothetical protein Ct9H90mP30_6400 [Actinomycetota bacterium]|nr:MAG: hypothetical protein Ct9H90mP30_6400 [Actinomycetota bacterium]